VILVDSNILMYASGAEHPNKAPSLAFLKRVAAGDVEATVDAGALQEAIHRYRALHRWAEGQRVYELARTLFPEVLAITGAVMDYAKQIADKDDGISARDAVHAAVIAEYKLEGICTFDGDFDRIRGCKRVGLRPAPSDR
jgi:predicted nucleic acid-binding protein